MGEEGEVRFCSLLNNSKTIKYTVLNDRLEFLVWAPDSINGDGSAAAAAAPAGGAAILDGAKFEMNQGTYLCYSLKFR